MTTTTESQPFYTSDSVAGGHFHEQNSSSPIDTLAYGRQVNEYIAEQNVAMDSHVPDTLEEADSLMAQYGNQISRIVKKGDTYDFDGVTLEPDEAEAFIEMAHQGRNWWRLGEQEENDISAALQASTFETMPASMQSLLRNSKPTEGPATIAELADFRVNQAKRYALNLEIKRSESLQEPETSNSEPQAETTATEEPAGNVDPIDPPEPATADPGQSESEPQVGPEHGPVPPPTPQPPKPPKTKPGLPSGSVPPRKPRIATLRNGIADLVDLDSRGYARYGNGKKMPAYELDVIEEHQDEIREGMDALEDRAAYIKEMRGMEEFAYKNWKDPSKGLVSDKEYEKRLEELLHEYDATIFAGTARELPDHPEQRSRRALKTTGRLAETALRSMMRTDRFMIETAVPKAAENAVFMSAVALYAGRNAVRSMLRGADRFTDETLPNLAENAAYYGYRGGKAVRNGTKGLKNRAVTALSGARPTNIARTFNGAQALQKQPGRRSNRRP